MSQPTHTPSSSAPRFKRRRKLIKPGLQLRLTGIFLGFAILCFLLQGIYVAERLANTSVVLPTGSAEVIDLAPGLLASVLLASFLLFTPILTAVGVLVTFKVAGPVYRFETFLRDVAGGSQVDECRIRKGDELQELCEAINAATAEQRERNAARAAERTQAA